MTIRAGVIGWPIHHSKSPLIHSHWLARHGIDATYEAIAIAPENLEAGVASLQTQGFRGFNVTVPHKQVIIPLLDRIDPVAAAIGAVNTVILHPDGTREGRNTDAFGFIANLKQEAPAFDLTAGPGVILGAGGAARAIVYALLNEGVTDLRIVNRTRERADALAADFPPATAHDWSALPELLTDAHCLVNTTSLGMVGQQPLNVDLTHMPAMSLINDIVYAPLYTRLLTAARDRGLTAVTGIGMLLHQARPAFHAWFGIMPEVDEALAQKVLA